MTAFEAQAEMIAEVGRRAVHRGFRKARAPRTWVRDTSELRQTISAPYTAARFDGTGSIRWAVSEELVATTVLPADWGSEHSGRSLMYGTPRQLSDLASYVLFAEGDDIEPERRESLLTGIRQNVDMTLAWLDRVTTRRELADWIVQATHLRRSIGSWQHPVGNTLATALAALLRARDDDPRALLMLDEVFAASISDPDRGDLIRSTWYDPLRASATEFLHLNEISGR